MDYNKLALEFLNNMGAVRRAKPQKNIDEALHGENFILGYIARHGGDVNPGEISQEMGVSSARVATALNNLEKKGLITRQIDLNNRSKILVGITAEGKELTEKYFQEILGVATKMLEFLGEQDAKEYIRIMKKLAEFKTNCDEQE